MSKPATNNITLITGGVASGKSAWALKLGETCGSNRAFLATATAQDAEMQQKIDTHRQERGNRWQTFEEPRDIAGTLEKIDGRFDVVIVDCLTLWVSNLLTLFGLSEHAAGQECARLVAAAHHAASPLILVSNEVTMGIMPADALSRSYQRLLGRLNKDMAAVAGTVYYMVCGIAQKIK